MLGRLLFDLNGLAWCRNNVVGGGRVNDAAGDVGVCRGVAKNKVSDLIFLHGAVGIHTQLSLSSSGTGQFGGI